MATLIGNIRGPQGPPGEAGVADWTLGYPTYDLRYVNLGGDQMTGPLWIAQSGPLDLTTYPGGDLQIGGNSDSVAPVNTILRADSIQARTRATNAAWPLILNPLGQAVRVGAHAATDSSLQLLGAFPTGSKLRWFSGGQEIAAAFPYGPSFPLDFVIQMIAGPSAGSLALQSGNDIRLEPAGVLTVVTSGAEKFRVRTNAAGEIVTVAGDPTCYQYFRNASPSGQIQGYIGSDATWGMRATASVRDAILHAANGDARVQGSGVVDIYSGGTYTARFATGGSFFMGKTAHDDASAGGLEWYTTWMSLRATCNVDQAASLYLNKRGAGAGTGQEFVVFSMTETKVGSITRTSGGVAYNTTSDYRAKDVHGPITGARERLGRLRPVRAVYHADESHSSVDAFVAHEVAEVVPEAVTGEKDAVATEDNAEVHGMKVGDPILQQLDNSKLIPLLVAAVQELSAKVEELETEIATLKGAA